MVDAKGGSEATVRVAEADLVPTEANLLPEYSSFGELKEACAVFGDTINARVHRSTRRIPLEMLMEERSALHRLPERPFTACFGVTRTVGADVPVITFDACLYSVPHDYRGQVVWVRGHGDEVIVTAVTASGPQVLVRHQRGRRAIPNIWTSTSDRPPRARCTAPPKQERRPSASSWPSVTEPLCG